MNLTKPKGAITLTYTNIASSEINSYQLSIMSKCPRPCGRKWKAIHSYFIFIQWFIINLSLDNRSRSYHVINSYQFNIYQNSYKIISIYNLFYYFLNFGTLMCMYYQKRLKLIINIMFLIYYHPSWSTIPPLEGL